MRRMRVLVALARIVGAHFEPAAHHPQFIRRHAIRLVSGLALAGRAVEFPVVPRADDVLAIQAPLAERAAGVVAGAGDDAELAVLPGDRDLLLAEARLGQLRALEILRRTDILPTTLICHGTSFSFRRPRGFRRGPRF